MGVKLAGLDWLPLSPSKGERMPVILWYLYVYVYCFIKSPFTFLSSSVSSYL